METLQIRPARGRRRRTRTQPHVVRTAPGEDDVNTAGGIRQHPADPRICAGETVVACRKKICGGPALNSHQLTKLVRRDVPVHGAPVAHIGLCGAASVGDRHLVLQKIITCRSAIGLRDGKAGTIQRGGRGKKKYRQRQVCSQLPRLRKELVPVGQADCHGRRRTPRRHTPALADAPGRVASNRPEPRP